MVYTKIVKLFCHVCDSVIKSGASYAWYFAIENEKYKLHVWLCEKHLRREDPVYFQYIKAADEELRIWKKRVSLSKVEKRSMGSKKINAIRLEGNSYDF